MASSRHYYELDSLRGIAALTVVFHHFRLILGPQTAENLGKSPIEFFIPGHEAVILFFVLSGFVLTLPYQRSNHPGYFVYLVKRVCRIYLPYLAALALSIAGAYEFHHAYIPSNIWANGTWSHAPTLPDIVAHVLFIGDYDWPALNTAFWSLIHEMRVSLIFPLIAFLVLRIRSYQSLALAALLALGASTVGNAFSSLMHGSVSALSISRDADTVHYAGFFIAGSVLAKNIKLVSAWFERLSTPWRYLFGILSACLYNGASVMNRFHRHSLQRSDELAALGAMMLIVLALNADWFRTFLQHSTVHYLGRISYSVYLVHGTVLFALIGIFYGKFHFIYLLPLYLVLTLGISALFHQFIEKPSMRLGRRLAELLSPAKALPSSRPQPSAVNVS